MDETEVRQDLKHGAKRVLKGLAVLPEQPEPIVSVYLNTWWSDEHRREQVRVFVQDQLRKNLRALDSKGYQLLSGTAEKIEEFVSGLLRHQHDEWATGAAIFACKPSGLFRVLTTRAPFEPMELVVDSRPYILPLAKAVLASPTVLAAAVDSEGGSLYEWNLGVVELEIHIEKPSRPYTDWRTHGGRSQSRFAKSIGETRIRNLKAVAEPLIKASDSDPSAAIVLIGQHNTVKVFEELLPERIVSRIAGDVRGPPMVQSGEIRDELMHEVQEQVDRVTEARLRAERDHIMAEAARGGLGAVGALETLAALDESRIHKLYLEKNYKVDGKKCTVCAKLAEFGNSCSNCGGSLSPVVLAEEIVRKALMADAEIVWLPPEAAFPSGVSMAALLRHKLTLAAPEAEAESLS